MDNNKIGKFIASLRKGKKLTQQQLADKLFVTDKAVSKWERGLSLPDITILGKLADELDTDIYSILQIEKRKNIDIEKILEEEKIKIKKQLKKKVIIIALPLVFLISIILFKLVPFGFNVVHLRYAVNEEKLINLGVPKFSFWLKNNENSYSYKNFRGKNILRNEAKNYLNSLEHISCNNTTYYYDTISRTTFIDYSVKGNLFYNTISYSIIDGNYCNILQIKEYQDKLGNLNTTRTLYKDENEDSKNTKLVIYFIPEIRINELSNEFKAKMQIYYLNGPSSKIIEQSSGTFEIKDDELIYYRVKITEQAKDIKIPNVSNFVIKKQKLILKDNYLKDYEKGITLK